MLDRESVCISQLSQAI